MEVEKVARSVESWWKIIMVIVALVLFIYNVSAVWIKLVDAESRLEDMEQMMEQENQIRDERWERKYKELENMNRELRNHGIDLTKGYQQHLIEDAYFRGSVDAKIQMLQLK